MAMSKTSDLEIFSVYFDEAAFMQEVLSIIDGQVDTLSMHMDEVICEAIAQNTEASDVMIGDTLAQVKEISRTVTSQSVEIEVGIDEGDIGGGTQTIVRVLVTLHGNGHIVTKPGGSTWKKNVTGPGASGALSVYSIPQFDQGDHSGAMMQQFYKNISQFANEFLETVVALIQAIDFEKYLRIG